MIQIIKRWKEAFKFSSNITASRSNTSGKIPVTISILKLSASNRLEEKSILLLVFEKLLQATRCFFEKAPALLYAMAFFVGIRCQIQWEWAFLFPISAVILSFALQLTFYEAFKKGCRVALLIAVGVLYVPLCHQMPSCPKEGLEGTGILSLASIQKVQNHTGRGWLYRGILKNFTSKEGVSGRGIPVSIFLSADEERPLGDHLYVIKGKLLQNPSGVAYKFKMAPRQPWIAYQERAGLAELRYRIKQNLTELIHKKIKHPSTAEFLCGLVVGEFHDLNLKYEFSRFGLQHIMAISGFHFALLAAFLHAILRIPFSGRTVPLAMACLLTLYFIFIGPSPSVFRAWVMAFLALAALILERQNTPFNSLGIALLLVLAFDPLASVQLGFILSFLATAAILLLYKSMDFYLEKLFSTRRLSGIITTSFTNQSGYVLMVLMRRALALGAAVNLVTFPVIMETFHRFPLMGVLYNLFFPFLVSLALFLLLTALLVWFCFPISAKYFFWLTDQFTTAVLRLVSEAPPSIDAVFRTQWINAEISILAVTSILLLGVYLQEQSKEEVQWNYI